MIFVRCLLRSKLFPHRIGLTNLVDVNIVSGEVMENKDNEKMGRPAF